MKSSKSTFLLSCLCTIGFVFLAGCDTGGKEGEVCNPLVAQDECHTGLHCTYVTCTTAFCCPTSGQSTDPNCANITACPDEAGTDGGDEGGTDGGSDAGNNDTGVKDTGTNDGGSDSAGD